jgi:hypothetical protein
MMQHSFRKYDVDRILWKRKLLQVNLQKSSLQSSLGKPRAGRVNRGGDIRTDITAAQQVGSRSANADIAAPQPASSKMGELP